MVSPKKLCPRPNTSRLALFLLLPKPQQLAIPRLFRVLSSIRQPSQVANHRPSRSSSSQVASRIQQAGV
jgi:hypothetical protein